MDSFHPSSLRESWLIERFVNEEIRRNPSGSPKLRFRRLTTRLARNYRSNPSRGEEQGERKRSTESAAKRYRIEERERLERKFGLDYWLKATDKEREGSLLGWKLSVLVGSRNVKSESREGEMGKRRVVSGDRDIVGKISRGSGRLYARRMEAGIFFQARKEGRKRWEEEEEEDCAFPLGLRSTILGV